MSPLESSVSFWDGLAFWLTVAGATLVFFGGVSSVVFRRYNRQLLKVRAIENQRERDATAKSLAEANTRASEAQRDAAIANEKAEHERLERMKIELRLAPRRLTADEQKRIAAKIAPFGPVRISVFEPDEPRIDPEIRGFTYNIASALGEAGWKASVSRKSDTGRVIVGVIIEMTTADPHLYKAAESLAEALKQEGVFTQGPMVRTHQGFTLHGNWGDVDAPIHVIVGTKPDFQ